MAQWFLRKRQKCEKDWQTNLTWALSSGELKQKHKAYRRKTILICQLISFGISMCLNSRKTRGSYGPHHPPSNKKKTTFAQSNDYTITMIKFCKIIFFILLLCLLQKIGGTIYLIKLDSPLPKDTLSQVWFKLAPWFRRRWRKCEKLTTTKTRMTWKTIQIGWFNLLRLAKLFWRRLYKHCHPYIYFPFDICVLNKFEFPSLKDVFCQV